MTFMPVRILAYPYSISDYRKQHYEREYPTVRSIQVRADVQGVGLWAWVTAHKLGVTFLTGGWSRVPVTGAELRAYYREVLTDGRIDADLEAGIVDGDSYLIEIEEDHDAPGFDPFPGVIFKSGRP
jgi:hypothetical protein